MATSKLQRIVGNMLDREFPGCRVRENYRPDWLLSSEYTKLELDFFIEEINVALEVQGMQHYEFIPHFFKTQEDFEKRQQYDQEKKELCAGHGIRLYEILTETDAIVAIKELKDRFFPEVNPPAYTTEYSNSELIAMKAIAEHEAKKPRPKKRNKAISRAKKALKVDAPITLKDKKIEELHNYRGIAGRRRKRGESAEFSFTPIFLSKSMMERLPKIIATCKCESEFHRAFIDLENEIMSEQ